MEFSCHIRSFPDLTLLEATGTIARLGFRQVDLAVGPHLPLQRLINKKDGKTLLKTLQSDLAHFDLSVADFAMMLPRISINDDNRRDEDLAHFRALLPLVTAVNASGITVSPGLVHPAADTGAFERTVAALTDMVAAAQAADLDLSIQPHPDSMAQTAPQVERLLAAVPELSLTLDRAFLLYAGFSEDEMLALLPRTRHVHLRQATATQLQVPFDEGDLDISAFIHLLLEQDYTGSVSVSYLAESERHGIKAVETIMDALRVRDAAREARDSYAATVS